MSTTSPSAPRLSRLEQAWLAGITLSLLALLWSAICTAPGIPWNAFRLAPSFALARGLPIYELRNSGAHLGWVYGPVFPLWHLPAGLTDNPTLGFMIATVLNAVALVAPLWVVFRSVLGRSSGLVFPMTLLGTVLLVANPLTNLAFSMVHVDGLCVGWGILACVALHARVTRDWKPGFPLAAAALALAVATKQVAVVLVPATILWLWRERQTRLIGSWIVNLGGVCGGLAILCLWAFDPEKILFNVWLLFSRMPWRGGWGQLGVNVLGVVTAATFWIAAGILAAWFMKSRGLRPSTEAAAFARLLVWAAVIQAPMGLTASLIVDAELNSIHSPVYLLVAGLVVAGSSVAQAWGAPGGAARGIRLAFAVTTAAGICVGYSLVLKRDTVWTPYRGQEKLLETVRSSPGKFYLPWNPLLTIIAEKKIYPHDEALHNLWLAGLEPPRAAIKAAVPAGAVIVYEEPCQTHFALNYFGRDTRDPAVER